MATTTKKVRSKSDHVAINLGLEVLHPRPDEPSKSSTKFDFDIVAIPGLGANPEWTWKYGKTVHWLRDSNMLPKKIPNARISVLHYESQWYGKDPIDQKLENVVDQLLYALERSRGHDCKAPIIFVCHCFGGIVLEQALLTAKLRQNDFPSVFPWVVGSIFLGTPFNGTKTQSKGMLLAGIASVWGGAVQSSLLKLLEKDSETLKRTLHDFVRLSTEAQIRVFCFFEGEKSDVVGLVVKGFAKELMVDKESATYPGVECLQLALDHFALNKYSGPKDGNFISVSNEIKVTASRAANVIKSRQNANRQALIGDRTYHAIIDALGKGFSDIDAAMKGTFQYPKATEKEKPGDQMTTKNSWVVLKDSYKNWKEQHTSQLLWVHGRAGTGQDTIASSVIDSLQKSAKDLDEKPDERSDEAGPIVASFFCDQGDEKRRTLLGLLKLIVRQIIDRNQDLAVHLLTDSKKGKKGSAQDFDNESLSKVSFLWDGLQAMARDLSFGCIYIIIYGLDLLSQDSLAEFLQFTDDISAACVPPESDVQSNPIKWMVLSRSSRPNIEKALKHKALEINLDDSENSVHVKDELKERISAMVDELGLVASLAYFVKRHIHSRAEGNAIYVLLVIQELKNAQESGKASYVEFRALLESLPYGLTELYEHIRGRVLKPESEGIEYTKEILRCMILSQETPSMRELAVIAGLPREHWEEYATLKAHIIRCGAFLTIRGSNLAEDTNTVGWVDMSAKEHLEHYSQDDLGLDLKDMHHGIIALRCLEYLYERHEKSEDAKTINQAIEEDPDDSREEPIEQTDPPAAQSEGVQSDCGDHSDSESNNDTDEDEAESVPQTERPTSRTTGIIDADSWEDALNYPVKYWIEHAKLAPVDVIAEFGVHQDHAFWEDESTARQAWWGANDQLHYMSEHADVSVLHIATIAGFSAFVDYLLTYGWESDVHKEDSLGFQPLFYACGNGSYEIVLALLGAGADVNACSEEGEVTPLWEAASEGRNEVVECLLDRDANVNADEDSWGTPLYAAAEERHLETMKILLKRGAMVNMVGGEHRRALNIAAYNGDPESVQLLVDQGADIDPDEEYEYGSALGAASRRGHANVVKLLLSKGWSPNKSMTRYGSFLTAAATYGHVEVVEALVQKEARITVLEQALQASSQNGKAAVVKTILDSAPTLRHEKAFMLAASYGRNDVLDLLLQRGIPKDKLNAALYHASDHEHTETVKLLLEFGADPNAEGAEYGNALTASAHDGTKEILEVLLEKGADVNKRGGDYGTALQAAAFHGDSDNVKLLLDYGAEVNTDPIGKYGNPLQAACKTGDASTIKILLDHGANVNAEGGCHSYAIIAAVDEGDSETTTVLLEHNADVNVRGGEDNHPVISLAGLNLVKEDLEAILDKGADIDATCDKGTTALINTAWMGDTEGLEFFLSRGADIHMSSDELGTALHAAAGESEKECCEILLKAGANVNAIGGTYGTALQAAAYDASNDIDTVRMLLNAGADVGLTAGQYGSALQAAVISGNIEVVRELIDHEATIDHRGGEHDFPLQAAASLGHKDIMELLLSHGAEVNLKGDAHGNALLAAASKPDNEECIQLLLDHGAEVKLEGGRLGSAVQAAAYGNNLGSLELLLDRGASVHTKGGKYGCALQAAAVKADVEFIDVLLDKAVDVNYCGGKYGTAIQAATCVNRVDVVKKLLNHGADFRNKGGLYGNALNAAAVRGHKDVLGTLLDLKPAHRMLDEALVESCYNRQTASVEALLKAGASVYGRHPTLGLPTEALQANAPADYNSDDEDEGDLDDSDSEDSDDDPDTEDEEEWEGDDKGSIDGDTEGSVTDLQLEDEVSDEAKIEKLLQEAMARVKRNPSVKRFRSVKRKPVAPGHLPQSLTTGPPQNRPESTAGTRLNPAFTTEPYRMPAYASQSLPQRDLRPDLGTNPYGNIPSQRNYPTAPLGQSYAPYQGSVNNPPQPRPSQYPTSSQHSQERPQVRPNQGYGSPQRQYSNTPPAHGSAPPFPPRQVSQDSSMYGRHRSQPSETDGSPGHYEQPQRQSSYQMPQAGYRASPPAEDTNRASVLPNRYSMNPPQSNYHSSPQYSAPPQQTRHSPSQIAPFDTRPPQPPYRSPPVPQPQYTGQETGYVAYNSTPGSQNSARTSQSSQYVQPTQYNGNQRQSQIGTPNASQTSGAGGQQSWK